jgi:hypothetical protein
MTGTNFSSWYRVDEGTLYTDALSSGFVLNSMLLSLTDGTLNRLIQVYADSTTNIKTNAWASTDINAAYAVNTAFKYAVGLQLNNTTATTNGTSGTIDTSTGSPVSLSQLNIGNRNGSLFWNGTLKKISYYPRRLSNSEIQSLTVI